MSLLYAAQIKTDDGKIGVYHDGSLNLPKRLTVVPATDVVDIAIEDGKAASKRLTAARVAAVGVLALAIKKTVDATKYIVIETTEDAYVYEISAKRYREAREFVKRAQVAVARQEGRGARSHPGVAHPRRGHPCRRCHSRTEALVAEDHWRPHQRAPSPEGEGAAALRRCVIVSQPN